jgi:hypothetical protein
MFRLLAAEVGTLSFCGCTAASEYLAVRRRSSGHRQWIASGVLSTLIQPYIGRVDDEGHDEEYSRQPDDQAQLVMQAGYISESKSILRLRTEISPSDWFRHASR